MTTRDGAAVEAAEVNAEAPSAAHEFLRHSAHYFLGSSVAYALSYAYHPVLARLLTVAQFGELQALLAVFTLGTAALSAGAMAAVDVSARTESEQERHRHLDEWYAFTAWVVVAAAASAAMLTGPISGALSVPVVPFWIVLAVILLNVPVYQLGAELQGRRDFARAAGANVLTAAARLAGSAALVAAGLGVAGATGGILVAYLGTVLYLRRALPHRPLVPAPARWPAPRRQPLVVAGGLALVTALSTVDVILVKHWFDPHLAGAYSGVSAIARMVFYATSTFAGVLLASVGPAATPHVNRGLLLRSLALVAAVGGGIVLVLAGWPRHVLLVTLGADYVGMAPWLGRLAALYLLLSVCGVLVTYHLGMRRRGVLPVLGGAVVLLLWAAVLRHRTPGDIVAALAWSATLLAAALCLPLLRELHAAGPAAPPA